MNTFRHYYPTYAINLILSTPWNTFKDMGIMDQMLRDVKSLLPQDLIDSIFSETGLYDEEKHELLKTHLKSIAPTLMHAVNAFHSTCSVLHNIQAYTQSGPRECQSLMERIYDLKMLMDSCTKDVETLKQYERNLISLAKSGPKQQAAEKKQQANPFPNGTKQQQQVIDFPPINVTGAGNSAMTGNKKRALVKSVPTPNPFAKIALQSSSSNNYNVNNHTTPVVPTPDSPPSHITLPPATTNSIPSPNTTKKRERDTERRFEYDDDTNNRQFTEERIKTKKQKVAPCSLHVLLDNPQQMRK